MNETMIGKTVYLLTGQDFTPVTVLEVRNGRSLTVQMEDVITFRDVPHFRACNRWRRCWCYEEEIPLAQAIRDFRQTHRD